MTSLDLCGEVMVGPAAIAQIAYLQLQVFTELRSSSLSAILLNLLLDFSRVEQLKLKEGDVQRLCHLIVAVFQDARPLSL